MSRADLSLARRIVRALLTHLEAAGWRPTLVETGDYQEESQQPLSADDTLDELFAVDSAYVYFRLFTPEGQRAPAVRGGTDPQHFVTLIPSNGEDVLCDWSFAVGDLDGFGALMESFDSEAVE